MYERKEQMREFDVIVVGGGHAGIEAAVAAAKTGVKTAMITMDKNAVGRMSCNPAIGGSAKGHLVHEIDALGGVMGLLADSTGIQFRTLNKSKGPAVWAGRCQSDRKLYSEAASRLVQNTPGLEIIEDAVVEAFEENKSISGIKTLSGEEIKCKTLIVCSGTFMNGLMHTGMNKTEGGRFGEKPSSGLTASFEKMGFVSGRLKTGTPPRLAKNSLNYDVLTEQPGDENPRPFSLRTDISRFPELEQVNCWLTYTDTDVHKILEKGFDESPLFRGVIKGAGPRYCPSIEDKIVRFADKTAHQLFLEPEGLEDETIYVNGFSTSLPAEIQLEAIRRIKGLENAEMIRPGYAVEYDYFPPYQVDLTLETKLIKGLYFAGQINGTSGYEEAAGQGLIAGINAAQKVLGKEQIVLTRSDAYIGVLIDDLVGKSTDEPYRMFTSRAEHRLLLRQDNSDRRLIKFGHQAGLVSDEELEKFNEYEKLITGSLEFFEGFRVKPDQINDILKEKDSSLLNNSETINKLSKRPDMSLKDLLPVVDENEYPVIKALKADERALEQVEIEMKYEGYIMRQQEMVKKLENLEKVNIPLSFNYSQINAISAEGREKLNRVKPRSLGQASRISGVSPSDISVLLVYLKN